MADVDVGEVVSVNVAVVRTGPWTGRKERSGIDKRAAADPVRVDVAGLVGDTVCDRENHGGPGQAVYAYSTDDLDFWAEQLAQPVEPGNVGENLTVSGVDCSHAVIGERWRVGGAVLRVTGPRTPCRVLAGFLDVRDMVKRFLVAGRPGCYLAVEQPGLVSAGDPVTVLSRPAHGVTVAEFMAAMAGDRSLLPRVARARDDVGERGRDWLTRVLESHAAAERGEDLQVG